MVQVVNKLDGDKHKVAIHNECARFERHTKSLSDKANDIISTLKNTLATTQDKGFIEDNSEELTGISKEKDFISQTVSLLKDDVFQIQEWGRKSKVLENQINDIIHQLMDEYNSIDPRIKKMSSPFLLCDDLLHDIEQSKLVGRPLLLEGEDGIGKTSLIYAFGIEYTHNVIRISLQEKHNVDNLFFEMDLNNEHIIFGPLGHAVVELGKWKSKQDKIHDLEGTDFNEDEIYDDAIPIILIEGIENVNQETAKKILIELEKDHISFNPVDFSHDFSSKVKPFVVLTLDTNLNTIPIPIYNLCYPVEVTFPDYNKLVSIVQLHFPTLSKQLVMSAVNKFQEMRNHAEINQKPSLRELMDWIDLLSQEGVTDISVLLNHHLDVLLKNKDDHVHFESQDEDNETHYSINR